MPTRFLRFFHFFLVIFWVQNSNSLVFEGVGSGCKMSKILKNHQKLKIWTRIHPQTHSEVNWGKVRPISGRRLPMSKSGPLDFKNLDPLATRGRGGADGGFTRTVPK